MPESKTIREVRLLPGLFKDRMEVNRAHLMSLNNDALLQNFYLEAGIIIPGRPL